MAGWITINSGDLHVSQRQQGERGAEIIIGLPPDDIPDKVRGRINRDKGECIITLSYFPRSKERRILVKPAGVNGKVKVGVNSGRLYQLRVPFQMGHDLPPQVELVIDSLAKDKRFADFQRQYRVAGEAVTDNADAILAR